MIEGRYRPIADQNHASEEYSEPHSFLAQDGHDDSHDAGEESQFRPKARAIGPLVKLLAGPESKPWRKRRQCSCKR